MTCPTQVDILNPHLIGRQTGLTFQRTRYSDERAANEGMQRLLLLSNKVCSLALPGRRPNGHAGMQPAESSRELHDALL